ncbi:MAG: VOC family protein [Vulcanimicrobiaceae bacterium]
MEQQDMKMQDSPGVKIALAHIDAWGNHDWDKTRELLTPNVHALVTTTDANFPNCAGSEFTGIDDYMVRKIKGAQLVEPGSLQVLSAVGDASNALILMTMRIALGPNGTIVTMARAGLTMLDERHKSRKNAISSSCSQNNIATEKIMAKVIFGNHSSVLVPRQDRENIRRFYCDVLGGTITRADPERDFLRLGDDFYIGFLYGDVSDESEFLRSFRAVWFEIKSDSVEEMSRKILGFPNKQFQDGHSHGWDQTLARLVGFVTGTPS